MFLDASAIVAIIAMEPDEPELSGKLEKAARRLVSPLSIYEASLAGMYDPHEYDLDVIEFNGKMLPECGRTFSNINHHI